MPTASSGSPTSIVRPTSIAAATDSGRHARPNFVPNIFVSQEDVVWQEATNTNNVYTIGGVPARDSRSSPPSPVVPDLNTPSSRGSPISRLAILLDVHRPAEQRVQRRVVRRQHRDLREPAVRARTPIPLAGTTDYQVDGETVVEAIFGYSEQDRGRPHGHSYGYGAGADRTVLLRWNGSAQPDPVVKVGDWIADVTYERSRSRRPTLPVVPQPRGAAGGCPTRSTTASGTTCRPALLLVPGPEGHAGPDRPVPGRPLSLDGRLRRPEAGGPDAPESDQRQPGLHERRLDLPLRRQRDPADVFREVGESWRVARLGASSMTTRGRSAGRELRI